MPPQYAALEIAEAHHLWIETIGAAGPLRCGHVKIILGILLTGASIRHNMVRRLVTRRSIVFPTVDVKDIGL